MINWGSILEPVNDQLKFGSLTVDQLKQFLIQNYGLFLEAHTNYVTNEAIASDNKFIISLTTKLCEFGISKKNVKKQF